MKKILSAILGIMLSFSVQSQNIAINETGNQPDTSAMLDISSTTRGLLMPRMTKAQRNAITLPATGLLVFQTGPDSTGFHYYNGTQWLWLMTADVKTAWSLTGNSSTDSTINFLGTTDDKPIMLRQNNLPMGHLNSRKHNFFIGGGSGQNNTDERNTGFGDSTLTRNTTGSGNTAMGFRCMAGGTAITGINNTAAGQHTLFALTSGSQNTATGGFAMASMTTGIANVATGVGAMEYTTKGSNNVALGFWALRNADSTNNNVAVGHQALYSSDSSGNTGVGYNVLYYNNRKNNTAVGTQAGTLNNFLQTDQQLGIENTYIGYQAGYYANTGSKNVAIGHRALLGGGYFNADLPNNENYKRNVAVGDSVLFTTLGSDNVGVGFKALSKTYWGNGHVAVGSRSLTNTTATYPNTAIGYSSQDSCTTGGANTSMGSYALTKNTSGYNNTAIGNAAMYEATNAINPAFMFDNTAVGNDALRLARYSGETAIGAGALRNDTGSLYNTAVGYLSMYNHLRGNSNTAVGTSSLRFDTSGISNTALGTNSLYNHKRGDENTAVGVNALFRDTTSNLNVAMGANAMFNHSKNDGNTAVGNEAMYNDKTGFYNTALGWRSLRFAKNTAENVAVGVGSLEFTDSSMYNVAVGRGAMMGKGGHYNTAIGHLASGFHPGIPTGNNYHVTGTTSVGYYAGYRNFGTENTFMGFSAGQGASTDSLSGIENTGIGSYSFYFNTTGSKNAGLGNNALKANQTGSFNTAVGNGALSTNQTGSSNTAIGYNANTVSAALTNATAIGANAFVAQNNSLVLGSINGINGATADSRVGIGTTTPDSTLSVANKFAVGNSGTVQFDNSVSTMNYMFKSGETNANRMVFAHSTTFPGWGMQYIDAGDKFNFVKPGGDAFTVDLNNLRAGVNTANPDSTFSVANKFSVGSSGTVQYDNSVSIMNYMFKSGSSNANRMVFAHSTAFPAWGLQYQDASDRFAFTAGAANVMTVDLSSQRVGIGVAAPNYQLHLSTDLAAKLTTSTWTITSDMRLKTIDGNYTKGLQDIMKLNTIMYHYAKGNARNLATDAQAYGFSAQEVQKVFPEAVTEEKDGYLSLNIHPILVAYVNAFKEQQQQIDELKKQVAEKESSKELIEKLVKRIEALESKTK